MSINVLPRPSQAKAILGPGAAAMITQPMLASASFPKHDQKFMKAATGFWKSDWTIRASERVISGKFSTVDWHLEDERDDEIDDEYPDQRY